MNHHVEFRSLLAGAMLFWSWTAASQVLSWESTGGPLGGSPTSLFVDPVGTIFTGTFQGTGSGYMFQSTNGGDLWTKVNLPNQSYYCFAANRSGHIFTGTANAVYRSTNGGVSWQLLSNGLQNSTVTSLAINPHDTLFAGSGGGVWRSTDNGDAWSQVASGMNADAITVDQNGQIYAGGFYSGVWGSTDGGETWSLTALTNVWVGALAAISSNEVLAGLNSGGGVVRTTDGGSTWRQIGLAGINVSSIAVTSASHIFAASQDSGVYRSTDNGATWVRTGLPAASYLAVSPGGQIYAGVSGGTSMGGGSGGGVCRSADDGDTWMKVGLPNTSISALAIPAGWQSRDAVFAAADSAVFLTTDNGHAWLRTGSLPHPGPYWFDIRALFATSSGSILAGTSQWGIYRTTNAGTTWAQAGSNGETVCAFLEDSVGHLYAAGNNVVYLSTDGGGNWSPTGGSVGGSWLSSLAMNSTGDIFVGMVNQSNGTYVCRSTDDGQTWLSTGMTFYSVMALVAVGRDTLLAGCSEFFYGIGGGVHRSTDGGATWTEVSAGLISRDIRTLVRNSAGHVFAATSQGVYRSTNNGDLWEPASAGLTFPSIQSLAVNSDGLLFAGASAGGVFRTQQSTTSIHEAGREIPVSSWLEQNYPNPFNPTTTIRYALPERSPVTLAVFNALGQQVAVLQHGEQEAGYHEAQFDGSELASGIYLYRLQAGDFVQTRRLVLIR